MTEAAAPYHHGNARDALVAAGRRLLATSGATGLSLRGVAEAAGLSRQAPYNHFADKQALLAALAAEGFRDLAAALDAASAAADDGAEALAAVCAAYVRFALAAPALFRLMFSRELVAIEAYPEAEAACEAAYARCTSAVAAVAPAERVADLATLAWALVHGYATLMIELELEPADAVGSRAQAMAALVVAGAAEPGN